VGVQFGAHLGGGEATDAPELGEKHQRMRQAGRPVNTVAGRLHGLRALHPEQQSLRLELCKLRDKVGGRGS
jgi:hypothetical protein